MRFDMTSRWLASTVIVATVSVALAVSIGGKVAAGQSPASGAAPAKPARPATPAKVLKTPWGEPDLRGIWSGRTLGGTPIERPAEYGMREFLTDAEIAAKQEQADEGKAKQVALVKEGKGQDLGLAGQTFEERKQKDKDAVITGFEYNTFWVYSDTSVRLSRRTSLVVEPKDGKIPYKPELLPRLTYSAKLVSSNPPADFVNRTWRDRDTGERCITDGLTGNFWQGTGPAEIIQGPGWVAILNEQFRDRRVIPTDGRPHGNISRWFGDAVGRWEGQTLVIDTTNFIDMTGTWPENRFAQEWRTPSKTMHQVERFTRVSNTALDYELTVTDPSRFTQPFKIAFQIQQSPAEQAFFEYACHEGNYGMAHLLSQARNVEKGVQGNKK
jgi:hypothetical protein